MNLVEVASSTVAKICWGFSPFRSVVMQIKSSEANNVPMYSAADIVVVGFIADGSSDARKSSDAVMLWLITLSVDI